jgi:hypothetical protein
MPGGLSEEQIKNLFTIFNDNKLVYKIFLSQSLTNECLYRSAVFYYDLQIRYHQSSHCNSARYYDDRRINKIITNIMHSVGACTHLEFSPDEL